MREKKEWKIPYWFGREVNSLARRTSSNFQQSRLLRFPSFSASIHLLSLSKINRLIVSDVPLIGEVIFLSKGRHLPRDNEREREGIGVHHRILPSKDAGPLAFNADASFPLIPPQRDDHSRPATVCPRLHPSLSLSLPPLSLDTRSSCCAKGLPLLVLGVIRFVQRDYALVTGFFEVAASSWPG